MSSLHTVPAMLLDLRHCWSACVCNRITELVSGLQKGLLYLLRAADVRRLFPHAKTMQRGQSISFSMSHTLLDKPKPGFWSATRPTTPQLLVQQGIFHMDEVPGIILELMKNPAMRTTWKRAMQPCCEPLPALPSSFMHSEPDCMPEDRHAAIRQITLDLRFVTCEAAQDFARASCQLPPPLSRML